MRLASPRRLRAAVVLVCLALGAVVLTAPAQAATVADPVTPVFGAWVDPIAGYDPANTCLTTLQPGTELLKDLLATTYGRTAFDTLRACTGGVATSEHNDGRAIDFMLLAANPADLAVATSFLTWLTKTDAAGVPFANARRLGIMYVIWNRQMWQAVDPVWRPYTGPVPHIDHVHISLSRAGAQLQTSFWKPYLSTSCDPLVANCALSQAAVDLFTMPGYHFAGGRIWHTWCEPFQTATRCWTYIKATVVVRSAAGVYSAVYGWAFNNITYTDVESPAWDANPLAIPGAHLIGARSWSVTCSPAAATGPRVCRDSIWANVVGRVSTPNGYVFQSYQKWVFNGFVRLAAVPG